MRYTYARFWSVSIYLGMFLSLDDTCSKFTIAKQRETERKRDEIICMSRFLFAFTRYFDDASEYASKYSDV